MNNENVFSALDALASGVPAEEIQKWFYSRYGHIIGRPFFAYLEGNKITTDSCIIDEKKEFLYGIGVIINGQKVVFAKDLGLKNFLDRDHYQTQVTKYKDFVSQLVCDEGKINLLPSNIVANIYDKTIIKSFNEAVYGLRQHGLSAEMWGDERVITNEVSSRHGSEYLSVFCMQSFYVEYCKESGFLENYKTREAFTIS